MPLLSQAMRQINLYQLTFLPFDAVWDGQSGLGRAISGDTRAADSRRVHDRVAGTERRGYIGRGGAAECYHGAAQLGVEVGHLSHKLVRVRDLWFLCEQRHRGLGRPWPM